MRLREGPEGSSGRVYIEHWTEVRWANVLAGKEFAGIMWSHNCHMLPGVPFLYSWR